MHFSKEEITEIRDSMAQRNEKLRRYGYDSDASVAFILSKILPLPEPILEIGTGKGRFLAELLRHAPRVTTIDIDPNVRLKSHTN